MLTDSALKRQTKKSGSTQATMKVEKKKHFNLVDSLWEFPVLGILKSSCFHYSLPRVMANTSSLPSACRTLTQISKGLSCFFPSSSQNCQDTLTMIHFTLPRIASSEQYLFSSTSSFDILLFAHQIHMEKNLHNFNKLTDNVQYFPFIFPVFLFYIVSINCLPCSPLFNFISIFPLAFFILVFHYPCYLKSSYQYQHSTQSK